MVSWFVCFCISDIAWRMEKVCTEWLDNYMEDEEGMNGMLDIGTLTEQSERKIVFHCFFFFFCASLLVFLGFSVLYGFRLDVGEHVLFLVSVGFV